MARIKHAVILAAGEGRRMGGGEPKPLRRVAGREILYRTVSALRDLGVEEFVLVVNPDHRARFEGFLRKLGVPAEIVLNPSPEKGNGYSLYLAREAVSGPFLLVMGDHIYGEGFLRRAVAGEGAVVDPEPRFIDRDEATAVRVRDGRVADIGKGLRDPDAYDTGCFVLDPSVFAAAAELVAERREVELADVIRRAAPPVHIVPGEFWTDVDTPADLRRASRLLIAQAVKGTGDGIVSRLINRRISTRISGLLVDRITPWQATWAAFGVGLLAAGLNPWSPVAAAVLYQVSSILDGVDGEIARATLRQTPLGGWVDSVLDRYVDIAYLLALAVSTRFPAGFWPVVALALLGSVLVSYSTERYRGAFARDIYRDVPALALIPGKRDERIFLSMVLVLLGYVRELFLALALITHLRVLITLLLGSREILGKRG
ncbi:TPA: CDP-alcohol phosphatidyltransferase [Candidatus Bipolaricaulota bacterium]|nr:CDP-alcohol phosphatidyltransferase [Candidatus Bipolaricaulota bacterium]